MITELFPNPYCLTGCCNASPCYALQACLVFDQSSSICVLEGVVTELLLFLLQKDILSAHAEEARSSVRELQRIVDDSNKDCQQWRTMLQSARAEQQAAFGTDTQEVHSTPLQRIQSFFPRCFRLLCFHHSA